MAWPVTPISTTNLLDGTKNPSLARADLLLLTQAVNDIIASRGALSGIASLGSDGTVAGSQLSGTAVLAALVSSDGEGSTLDADLLDGLQGVAYATVDGSRDFTTSGSTALNVKHTTTSTATMFDGLRTYHNTSGTPAAGHGAAIGAYATAVGGIAKQGDIGWAWSSTGILSVTSKVHLRTMTSGALEDALVCSQGYLEVRQIATPSGDAASGRSWIYAKSGGLYYKANGVAETLLGAGGGGVTDHGALTGKDDDDHLQYLLATGARALTGTISFATYPPNYDELGANPTAPGSGKWRLFFKSGGLYTITGTGGGTVVGPLGTGGGGVSDHGDLTGKDDDDHTQYLLRQPAADVVINDSAADYDFRIEGTTAANLFNVDAGADTVTVNGVSAANSGARFGVAGGAGGGIFASSDGGAAFRATPSGGSDIGLHVETIGVNAVGVLVSSAVGSRSGYLLSLVDYHAIPNSLLLYMDGGQASPTLQLMRVTTAVGGNCFVLRRDGLQLNSSGKTDVSFKFQGKSGFHLIHGDSTVDSVGMGLAPVASTGRLQVYSGTDVPVAIRATVAAAETGVLATTASGIGVEAQGTTGTALKAGVTATAGTAAYIYRTVASSGGGVASKTEITHASDDGIVAQFKTAGSGSLLCCTVGADDIWLLKNGADVEWKKKASVSGSVAPAGSVRVWAHDQGLWWRGDSGISRLFVSTALADYDGATIYYDQLNAIWKKNDQLLTTYTTSGNRTNSLLKLRATAAAFTPNEAADASIEITLEGIEPVGASTNVFSIGPGLVFGVFAHVVDAITGATGFHVGTAADPVMFLADISGADETKTTAASFRPRPCAYLPTAQTIIVTAADGSFTGGTIAVSAHVLKCAHI